MKDEPRYPAGRVICGRMSGDELLSRDARANRGYTTSHASGTTFVRIKLMYGSRRSARLMGYSWTNTDTLNPRAGKDLKNVNRLW